MPWPQAESNSEQSFESMAAHHFEKITRVLKVQYMKLRFFRIGRLGLAGRITRNQFPIVHGDIERSAQAIADMFHGFRL